MKSRSAQVTLFIILGLVLVLVVALFFVLRKSDVSTRPSTQQTTHDFTSVVASYEASAQACVKTEGTRIFQQILLHGGYYDPQGAGLFAIDQFPTKGTALGLSGSHIVPFWIDHRSSLGCRGSCAYFVRIPPLIEGADESIEEQVERLIADPTQACLDRIAVSQDYGLVQDDQLSVEVTIGEDAIVYDVHRDVLFTHEESAEQFKLETVSARSSASVMRMYDIAIALAQQMELTNKTGSFGDVLKLVIETYSMNDGADLPPMFGPVEFLGGVHRWLLPDVKEALKLRIADNLPLIQVRGSGFRTLFTEPNKFSGSIYSGPQMNPDMFLPHDDYLSDVQISFMYEPDWDIDLDVYPRSGFIIEPDGISPFSLFSGFGMGFYDYRFTYDLRVPVLVVLTDEDAFDGAGATLLFALETGLEGNENIIWSAPSLAVEDYYGNLFNDESQRMYGQIAITAVDSVSGAVLPDVRLSYYCGPLSTDAGTTDDFGVSTTSLPLCLGGFVIGTLDGYRSSITKLNVVDHSDAAITVELSPYKLFDLETRVYSIYKSDAESGEWNISSEYGFLETGDQLMLILTKKTLPGEDALVQVKTVNYSNELGQQLNLSVGSFDVEAYLLRNLSDSPVVIPEAEECYNEGWFDGEKECETIPRVEFNSTMYVGGLTSLIDDGLGLEITPNDYGSTKIILNIAKVTLTDVLTHDDIGVFGKIETFSNTYNSTLDVSIE